MVFLSNERRTITFHNRHMRTVYLALMRTSIMDVSSIISDHLSTLCKSNTSNFYGLQMEFGSLLKNGGFRIMHWLLTSIYRTSNFIRGIGKDYMTAVVHILCCVCIFVSSPVILNLSASYFYLKILTGTYCQNYSQIIIVNFIGGSETYNLRMIVLELSF